MRKPKGWLCLGLGIPFLLACTGNLDSSAVSNPIVLSTNSEENSIVDSYLSWSDSVKGYELYCWREDTVWKAGLMVGTDRTKTPEEINALSGLSLQTMKEVLQAKSYFGANYLSPIIVSRPCNAEQISNRSRDYALYHPKILSYLCDKLGEDEEGAPISSKSGTLYALNVDATSQSYLATPLLGHYEGTHWVEVDTTILMDADLKLTVNGSLVAISGYSFPNESVWTYFFAMPEQDSTLSLSPSTPSSLTFEDAYPWAKNLTEEAIDRITCLDSEADIGPGAMERHYHGDSASDKKAFLEFCQDNALQEGESNAFITGGIPSFYSVSISGISYSFSFNCGSLDNRYVSSKRPPRLSSFDYDNFIAFGGGITLYSSDRAKERKIDDASFIQAVQFSPYSPSETPSLSGYFFDYGQGIYFVDARHFKYGEIYYEVTSEKDFTAYYQG
jgi:hypothetical protein